MNNLKLFWLLLKPSLSSSLLTILTSLAITVGSAWLYISHSSVFYDYFFGPYGISTTLLRAPDTTAALRAWLFGSPATYYIVLAVTAVIAGLTVLTILQGIEYLVQEGKFLWREIHAPLQEQKSVIRELFVRLTLRVIASMAWGIYIAFFVTIFLPFLAIMQQSGIDKLATDPLVGSLSIVGAFVILGILIHLHIIFARLVALRPRLYGVNDIELAEL